MSLIKGKRNCWGTELIGPKGPEYNTVVGWSDVSFKRLLAISKKFLYIKSLQEVHSARINIRMHKHYK